MNLNEKKSRFQFLAGIDGINKNTLEEGVLQNIAAGLGITLASLTSVLGQTLNKLNYEPDRKQALEQSLKNPEVVSKLKSLGVEDNNIQKQIDILNGREIQKYQDVETHSDKQLYSLMKMGYHLTASQSDTVLQKIQKESPEQGIDTIMVPLNEEAMFESGSFVLSEVDSSNIKNLLDSIENSQSVLLTATIISSTDRQRLSPRLQNTLKSLGYSPDNKGLSTARNNSVLSILNGFGIDSGIINQEILFERGSEIVSGPDRYVVVMFSVTKQDAIPEIEPTDKKIITNTYTLFRPLFKAGTKSLDRSNPTKVCKRKAIQFSKKHSPIECFFEGK